MSSLETGDLGARGFLSTHMLFFFFLSEPSDSDAAQALNQPGLHQRDRTSRRYICVYLWF